MSRPIANPMKNYSIQTGSINADGQAAPTMPSPRRSSVALWLLALCLAGAELVHAQDGSGVCRVKTTGTSGNSGSTWAQPMSLPSALDNAACSEIWVAAGVYKPTTVIDPEATFAIRSGVAVYGGFDGSEANRNERDAAIHRSVLSGDIGGNDVVDAHGITINATGIVGRNSYHVVTLGDASVDTVLDGFTLTGGQSNGMEPETEMGGGLFCRGISQGCSPTLSNLEFRGNWAIVGGGMGCSANAQADCRAVVENTAFVGNFGMYGGGMLSLANDAGVASVTVRNVTFHNNTASSFGGGFVNSTTTGSATATLSDVTFSNNEAPSGGAVVNWTLGGGADIALVNAILWGNARDEISSQGGTVSVSRSIVQGGCPNAATCTDMVTGDPKLGALQEAGGATPVMLPGAGSVALDAVACAADPATDQRGIARPQGAACDIGAAEVRQANLLVDVSGAGKVSAIVVPPPLGVAIADCRENSGACSAWYRLEPSAPAVSLTLHPDAGNVFQSVTGCAGNLVGTMFTTAALEGDCTLEVVFAPATHAIGGTVTGLAGSGLVLTLNADENLPIASDGRFTFDTTLLDGDSYAVTIGTQPSLPSQTCIVVNGSGTIGTGDITNVVIHCGAAATYSIGGTLSGLAAGASITLSLNGGNPLVLAANGAYVFAPRFAAGDGYLATVTAQPAGQHCTLSHAEGTVGSANVSNVDVACTAGGAQLQLGVTDGGDYARYGQIRDYFVTLSNSGNGPAVGIAIGADLDPAFDEANVQWACVGGAPGTACTAQGAGGFADTATLAPGTSLVWIVRVPIHADSQAAEATFRAHASGAADASDTDTLVIFRDGLDVPYADGAGVEDPALRETAVAVE